MVLLLLYAMHLDGRGYLYYCAVCYVQCAQATGGMLRVACSESPVAVSRRRQGDGDQIGFFAGPSRNLPIPF